MIRLVADVGGTNSRLAQSEAGVLLPDTQASYVNADWQNLYDIIEAYFSRPMIQHPTEMVIAVAGPVNSECAHLTNRNWTIETSRLKRAFDCKQVHLLNDLTALGYAVPSLRPDQMSVVSAGARKQTGLSQSLVVGIGTGFNVSQVLENAGNVLCPAAEAGHISMPLSVVEGLAAFGIAEDQFPTVEALFSGRGFTAFCQNLTGDTDLQGTAFVAAYNKPSAQGVTAAVDHYSTLLGHLLRDLSLSYMATSGIYLAGSVARAVVGVAGRHCVDILHRDCSIANIANIPVQTIEDDGAALLGCAGYFNR